MRCLGKELRRPRQELALSCPNSKSWRVFESSVCLFGALTSVYSCCHLSEVFGSIIQIFLRASGALYIDDLHSLLRRSSIAATGKLVEFFFFLTVWRVAAHKTEAKGDLKLMLTSLGLA